MLFWDMSYKFNTNKKVVVLSMTFTRLKCPQLYIVSITEFNLVMFVWWATEYIPILPDSRRMLAMVIKDESAEFRET